MLLKWQPLVLTFVMALCFEVPKAGPAYAYLLPSQQIIEFVAGQTSRIYNFRMEVLAESPDPNLPGAMNRREEVYYAARPDSLRVEVLDAAGASTVLVGGSRRLSVIDGHLLEETARHEEIFPILLLANSAAVLEGLLVAEQVDVSQVHLSRMDREIAYVIGGPPAEPEAPQFWCDKERFRPMRLVGRRSQQGVADLIDIRFLSYREVASGIWMPSVIEFYRRNQLFLRLVVQKAQPNESLPEALFDLEAFASKHPPLPLQKAPAKESAETLEEMRRYLEKKYQ